MIYRLWPRCVHVINVSFAFFGSIASQRMTTSRRLSQPMISCDTGSVTPASAPLGIWATPLGITPGRMRLVAGVSAKVLWPPPSVIYPALIYPAFRCCQCYPQDWAGGRRLGQACRDGLGHMLCLERGAGYGPAERGHGLAAGLPFAVAQDQGAKCRRAVARQKAAHGRPSHPAFSRLGAADPALNGPRFSAPFPSPRLTPCRPPATPTATKHRSLRWPIPQSSS